eukprot:CAMPEP_0175151118 /NCGR_PEP_ID=MMETSP0087-20121206/18298_1 /TAXON_ID=136419 /ORGANISM="Unknown Unknown, Strain D1" /LENGTH=277 /DNA_ID=CAMNT_0016437239 /DNA_START=214 /DNA_END=1043 /DNA_ORIENTATION=+
MQGHSLQGGVSSSSSSADKIKCSVSGIVGNIPSQQYQVVKASASLHYRQDAVGLHHQPPGLQGGSDTNEDANHVRSDLVDADHESTHDDIHDEVNEDDQDHEGDEAINLADLEPEAETGVVEVVRDEVQVYTPMFERSSNRKIFTVAFPHAPYISDPTSQLNRSIVSTLKQVKPAVSLRWRVEHVHAYNSVINAYRRAGFKETKSNAVCNGYWGRHLPFKAFKKLHRYQKVNHFPGSWGLGRKDLLAKNINKMRRRLTHVKEPMDFLPETFILPAER